MVYSYRPSATLVKGFRQWNDLGRWVNAGEKGIPILAPIIVKKTVKEEKIQQVTDPETGEVREVKTEVEVEKEVLVGFKVVYVFDVTQTNGKELPKVEISVAKGESILPRLLRFAKQKGIAVSFKTLRGSHHGSSYNGKVEVDARKDETSQCAVLVHELAHELLHWKTNDVNNLPKAVVESEAEATSYVVCKRFGIQVNSDVYLAIWQPKAEQIMDSLERIHKTAAEIISAVESIEPSAIPVQSTPPPLVVAR
jgi:antirestriction protein ArdC